jgi:hypothetical protein
MFCSVQDAEAGTGYSGPLGRIMEFVWICFIQVKISGTKSPLDVTCRLQNFQRFFNRTCSNVLIPGTLRNFKSLLRKLLMNGFVIHMKHLIRRK